MKVNGLRVESFNFSDSLTDSSLASWDSIPQKGSSFLCPGEPFIRSVDPFSSAGGIPLTPRPGARPPVKPLWDSGDFDSDKVTSLKLQNGPMQGSDDKFQNGLNNFNCNGNGRSVKHCDNGHLPNGLNCSNAFVVHNKLDKNDNDSSSLQNGTLQEANDPSSSSDSMSNQMPLPTKMQDAMKNGVVSGKIQVIGTENGASDSLASKVFLVKSRFQDGKSPYSPLPNGSKGTNGLSHGPMKSLTITRPNMNISNPDGSQGKPAGPRVPASPSGQSWRENPSPGGRFRAGLPEIKLDLRAVNRSRDMLEPTEMQLRRSKFAFFEKECSRILEHVYLGSDVVARNRETLKDAGISHVLNCVGFVCPNYFPEELTYKTLWLQDTPGEDITCVLYDVFDYIEDVRKQNGKVFVHCCQGVSRSTSLVIAYVMWLQDLSFEDSFRVVKNLRGITNPNMGFACQLLQWQKRVCGVPSPKAKNTPTIRFYRMSPHSTQDPSLIVPKALPCFSKSALDPHAAFLLQIDGTVYCWKGKYCDDAMKNAAKNSAYQLLKYEKLLGPVKSIEEGEETAEFWDAMNTASSSPSCDFTFPSSLPRVDQDDGRFYKQATGQDNSLHRNKSNSLEVRTKGFLEDNHSAENNTGIEQSQSQLEVEKSESVSDDSSSQTRALSRSLSCDCISPTCRKRDRSNQKTDFSVPCISLSSAEEAKQQMDADCSNEVHIEQSASSPSPTSFSALPSGLPSPKKKAPVQGDGMWNFRNNSFPPYNERSEQPTPSYFNHPPLLSPRPKPSDAELPNDMDTAEDGRESIFSFDLPPVSNAEEVPSPSLSFSSTSPSSSSTASSSSLPPFLSSSISSSSSSWASSIPNSPVSPLTSPRPAVIQNNSHVPSSSSFSSPSLSSSSSSAPSSSSSSSSSSFASPPSGTGPTIPAFSRLQSLPSPSSFSPRSLSAFPPSGMGTYMPSMTRLSAKPISEEDKTLSSAEDEQMHDSRDVSHRRSASNCPLPPMIWPSSSGFARHHRSNSESDTKRVPLYLRRSQGRSSLARDISLSSDSSDPHSCCSEDVNDQPMDTELNPFASLSPPAKDGVH